MNWPSRFPTIWRERGVRGVIAGALRRAARYIDKPVKREPERRTPTADEFLKWVGYAVPGMLAPGNVAAMEYAIAHMPPGRSMLEVGSFCGLSTIVMTYLADKHSRPVQLFTCDKWEFENSKPGAQLGSSLSATHENYRAYVKEQFLRVTSTFASHRLPHTIECFSDDFFERWFLGELATDVFGRSVRLGGDLSFCYIDGNHTYAFARRDFENADRALVRGSFILFDDSADGSGWEVNQLVQEIESSRHYELVSKNPNYMFRKK